MFNCFFPLKNRQEEVSCSTRHSSLHFIGTKIELWKKLVNSHTLPVPWFGGHCWTSIHFFLLSWGLELVCFSWTHGKDFSQTSFQPGVAMWLNSGQRDMIINDVCKFWGNSNEKISCWNMYITLCEIYHQCRSDAWDRALRAGALGQPWGIGWRGRWEGGSGWGTHVHPWLIHVNVWQKALQYCKVISLQLK